MSSTFAVLVDRVAARWKLSDRQRQVAALILGGLSGPDAAEQLEISYNTLKTHWRRLYRKLDVSSKEKLHAAIESATDQDASSPGPTLSGYLKDLVARAAKRLGLTDRQRQLVDLFVVCVSGVKCALRLKISYDTLKRHARQLLAKLGASSRGELLKTIEAAG